MLSDILLRTGVGLLLVILAVIAWSVYPYLIHPLRSSLLNLPGPVPSSWLLGSTQEIYDSEGEMVCDEWVKQYGRTYMYRGVFNVRLGVSHAPQSIPPI